MKLSFTIFLIIISTYQDAVGQIMDTSIKLRAQENFEFYNLKHKRQKTAAWICLGSGAALTITGFILISNNAQGAFVSTFGAPFGGDRKPESEKGIVSGSLLTIIGPATSLASIPLFISAGKNKRKASLSIKGEPLTYGKLNTRKSQLLSVVVTIDL